MSHVPPYGQTASTKPANVVARAVPEGIDVPPMALEPHLSLLCASGTAQILAGKLSVYFTTLKMASQYVSARSSKLGTATKSVQLVSKYMAGHSQVLSSDGVW